MAIIETKREHPRGLWMMAIVFVLSLMVYLTDGRSHLLGQSGDTRSNQLLPINLLAGNGFDFDRLFPAGEAPYAFGRVHGHLMPQYPIVPGLINTVTYVAASYLGHSTPLRDDTAYLSLVTGSIVTALSAAAVYLLLLSGGSGVLASGLLALLYAFGTSAFSVASRGIWQHGPALLFLSVGLVLLRSKSDLLMSLAGLSLGLAVESRVPVFVMVLPLFAIPWQRGLKSFAGFSFNFLLPIALMRVYAWYYWENPFVLAENMATATAHFVGNNVLEGLAGVVVSPGRGLFVYSPFLLFGVPGIISAVRCRDRFLILLAVGILAYIITVAVWVSWWGGKSFGTRMLTEIFPGGVLLSARPIAAWWTSRGWQRIVVVTVIGWSVLVNYAGARHYPKLPYVDEEEERKAAWSVHNTELVACLTALSRRIETHLSKMPLSL